MGVKNCQTTTLQNIYTPHFHSFLKKMFSESMFHIFENMKKNDDFFKTEE